MLDMSHDALDQRGEMVNSYDMKRFELKDVQREKEVEIERLARLDAERSQAEQRINELTITERTLARMLSVELPEPLKPATSDGAKRKKPDGIPTIYVMTLTLFRERGVHWLEGQEIVQAIRERWWPTADNNDISPTLWRLSKTEKLVKAGTKYGLPAGVRGSVKQLGEPGDAVIVQ